MKSSKCISFVWVMVVCLQVIFLNHDANAQEMIPNTRSSIFTYHQPPRYRESESHPLRIVAYALHPIGWVLREGIFRPISSFAGSSEATKEIMGFREPFDFRETDCFRNTGVPDCWSVAPFNTIVKNSGGDGMEFDDTSDSASVVSSERQVFIPDINFDYNSSRLNSLGQGRVRQISKFLASVPELTVVIEGHTDYKGTDAYNNKLGNMRAQVVIKELADLGVDRSRMSAISYGESRPIFTEEEDWARAVNRRVQFSIGTVEGASPADIDEGVESEQGIAPIVSQGSDSAYNQVESGISDLEKSVAPAAAPDNTAAPVVNPSVNSTLPSSGSDNLNVDNLSEDDLEAQLEAELEAELLAEGS